MTNPITDLYFWTEDGVQEYIAGVVETKGLELTPYTFLQDRFNFTKEYAPHVTMDVMSVGKLLSGVYANPDAVLPPVTQRTYTSKQFGFAYAKHEIKQAGAQEVYHREAGRMDSNLDNIQAALAADFDAQFVQGYNGFRILRERFASDIIFKGTHTAESPWFDPVVYDFGKNWITTEADLVAAKKTHTAYSVDLTTLNANGGVGKLAWDATGSTKPPTPYLDVLDMVKSQKRKYGTVQPVLIDPTALSYLLKDINTNYKDAFDNTKEVVARISSVVLPALPSYQGLDLVLQLPLTDASGVAVGIIPIYTYSAFFQERRQIDSTQATQSVVPGGYVAILPPSNLCIGKYGRIMHLKANFQPMEVFINSWSDGRTGVSGADVHTNFFMGIPDPDAGCTWKVVTPA